MLKKSCLKVFLSVVVFILTIGGVNAVFASQEYTATEDAYIRGGTYADDNYGTASYLVVRGETNASYTRKSFIKFNFTSYSGTSIGSAILRIHKNTDTAALPLTVYGLTDDIWTETGITWNNQPDSSGEVNIGTINATVEGWYTIDVTDYVNVQMYDKKVTFRIEDAAATSVYVDFSSSEGDNAPVLHIEDEGINDEFDNLRLKWMSKILGGSYNTADSDIQRIIAENDTEVQELWSTMDTSLSRTYLWSNYPNNSVSANIWNSYVNIYKLSCAYARDGSIYEGNQSLLGDIISGLDWLYDNWFCETTTEFGNWWDWDIGIPQYLHNSIVLLYDDLTPQQRMKYMNATYYHSPHSALERYSYPGWEPQVSYGANRIDKCMVNVVRGILMKEPSQIQEGSDGMSPVFDYVTTGDGFYEDGSFVQHVNIPYTGSYGIVTLLGIEKLLYVLTGSSWETTDTDTDVNNVYNWIGDSFEPVIYKGAAADFIRGRGISNAKVSDRYTGHSIINTIAKYSQHAPAVYANAYKSMIKYWVQEDTYYNHFANSIDIEGITLVKDILNDTGVVSRGQLNKHFMFPNMDRVMHRNSNGYAFGISMYSNRIANNESRIGGNNKRGWYLGEGMTYLYNDDFSQYSNNFWPTVDPYRLPGITVEVRPRNDNEYNRTSYKSWVGGTSILDKYGAAGMDLEGWDSRYVIDSLTAKKSWFMFDDEVIALGAGINSTDNRVIETIIENRKINSLGNNALLVNGVSKSTSLDWSETMNSVNWMHLAGDTAANDIGYYFPTAQTIKGLREDRTGSWSDIDDSGSTDPITKNYVTLWFDHGTNPANATYEYVLLMGKSSTEVSNYSSSPDFAILSNNRNVQAVKENTLNIVAANFWTDISQTVDLITCNKKASIMVKETEGTDLEVAVSDPTMENIGTIEITIDRTANSIASKDTEVTVVQLYPTIKISVNVNGAKGKTFKVKFNNIGRTYNPTDDATVRGGTYGDTNYGTSSGYLELKDSASDSYDRKAYIMFDYGEFSGTTAQSATLRVYCISGSPVTIKAYETASKSWDESVITWNNAPAAGTWIDDIPITTNDTNNWVEIDVTDFVNANMSDKVLSLVLLIPDTSSESYCSFNSVQGANKPELHIQ